MINDFFKKILDETSEEEKIFVDKYEEITMRIFCLLKEKGLTQKNLAEKLGKRPSEISKWLNEGHNLTLKTLAKIEAALGEKIISVPNEHYVEYIITEKASFKTHFKTSKITELSSADKYSNSKNYSLSIAG